MDFFFHENQVILMWNEEEEEENSNSEVEATVSLHMSQVAHQAGAYPGFCSMKWLGVFLLPPG